MIAKLTRCIYPRAWVASVALVIGPPARADHASDNAVVSAEDAFGLTIGTETIGLYDQNQVRGFSPQVAGNAASAGFILISRLRSQIGSWKDRPFEWASVRSDTRSQRP